MKAEIEHGIDDKDTWWYRCPVCHDPLDFKQKICGWCYAVIEWDDDVKDGDGDADGTAQIPG